MDGVSAALPDGHRAINGSVMQGVPFEILPDRLSAVGGRV